MTLPDIQFGVNWAKQYPKQHINTLLRRMVCARWKIGNVPVWEHRKAVMRALWPKREWHEWMDLRLKACCESNWVTWIGPGGSGKSTDAAMFALEYWLEGPSDTVVIVCSTSMKMLRMRIWNEITRAYNELPKEIHLVDDSGKVVEKMPLGPIGRMVSSETKIMYREGDDKHGITGVAVEEGPVEDVVKNHLGVHAKRVLLCMDEFQGVRPAILKAASSNMAKNEEFNMWGFGNPDNKDNLLGQQSEPILGWSSINHEVDTMWKTLGNKRDVGGICAFTSGLRSPADKSPAERKRLSFLINKDQIADHLYSLRGNADDPDYWTQSIGFFPPSGTKSTVLDHSIIEEWDCKGKAVWTRTPTKAASLDPAFSFGGGDKKVLQFFKYGQTEESGQTRWVIEFGRTCYVPVKSSSSRPLDYQILDYVKEQCELEGVLPEDFITDSTGIGRGLKSIFDVEWGPVNACEFGGAPSDRMVNTMGGKTAKEQYDDRKSELNLSVREFAMSNSIRGLPSEAASQFCIRKTEQVNKKQIVESKKELRKRISRSPDEADAICIAVDLAKIKGAVATLHGGPVKVPKNLVSALKQSDDYYAEYNYLVAV